MLNEVIRIFDWNRAISPLINLEIFEWSNYALSESFDTPRHSIKANAQIICTIRMHRCEHNRFHVSNLKKSKPFRIWGNRFCWYREKSAEQKCLISSSHVRYVWKLFFSTRSHHKNMLPRFTRVFTLHVFVAFEMFFFVTHSYDWDEQKRPLMNDFDVKQDPMNRIKFVCSKSISHSNSKWMGSKRVGCEAMKNK